LRWSVVICTIAHIFIFNRLVIDYVMKSIQLMSLVACRNFSKYAGLAILAGMLSAGLAPLSAQPITVPNYSFEAQTAPNTSPYVNINVDAWQKNPEPAFYGPAFGGFGIPWAGTAGVF